MSYIFECDFSIIRILILNVTILYTVYSYSYVYLCIRTLKLALSPNQPILVNIVIDVFIEGVNYIHSQ